MKDSSKVTNKLRDMAGRVTPCAPSKDAARACGAHGVTRPTRALAGVAKPLCRGIRSQGPSSRKVPSAKHQKLGLHWALGFGIWSVLSAPSLVLADEGLVLNWTNNLLTISSPKLPGGQLDIWYLEAFCRKGSTHRDWGRTTLPHKTVLLSGDQHHLRFRTTVQPEVEVLHDVFARIDEVEFRFELHNWGSEPVDLEWFQPACIRAERFTGLGQTNYLSRSFIFTGRGLTSLDRTRRREEALYRGGQVYVPKGIDLEDVNPRPTSPDQPVNGLIGCFSADGKYLLATAFDRTQELFQGVNVCLHSDPRVGGLLAGETKLIHGKLYLLKNDLDGLVSRYRKDFPEIK